MGVWRAAAVAAVVLAGTACTTTPSPTLVLPTEVVQATDAVRDEGTGTATGPATATARAERAHDATAEPIGPAELDRQLADTEELRARREALVESQIAAAVEDERIVEAFRAVPRHAFVPTDWVDRAYVDFPLPIEAGQTISQPSLVAMMTELVDVQPGDRVLEVGTGSGFQAAILAELTDEVYSVEIIPQLAGISRAVLDALGYTEIRLERRDGYLGWPEAAPFDAIVVTAAPDHLPRPLVEQLSPDGGRMVIPIGPVGDVQTLWLVTRNGGEVEMEEVVPVQFVPLTREEQ